MPNSKMLFLSGKCSIEPNTLQKSGGLGERLHDEGHAKLLKLAFKQRCHACWLRSCLRTYHLSSNMRSRLLEALPKAMRDTQVQMPLSVLANPLIGTSTSNPLSPFSIKREEAENQNDIPSLFSGPFTASATTNLSSAALRRLEEESITKSSGKAQSKPPPLAENNSTGHTDTKVEVKVEIPFTNPPEPLVASKEVNVKNTQPEKAARGRPRKALPPDVPSPEEKTKEVVVDNSNVATQSPTNPEVTTLPAAGPVDGRQKIDLKGPRVKHVCRSASVVLGQPLATFPLESLDTPPRPDSPSNVNMVDSQSRHNCSSCITEDQQHNLGLSPPATPIHAGDAECLDVESVVPEVSPETYSKQQNTVPAKEETIAGKGTRKATKVVVRADSSAIVARKNINKQSVPQIPMISTDFWENYDPVQISQTGFGLIVTEDVPVRSLCYLCGSLGSPDSLTYCVCCCEPYHQYCLEDEYNVKPPLDETLNISVMPQNQDISPGHLNWLCPRCTVCNTCNMSNGTKVKCQKCQKNYHSTCLGTSKRLLGADRPLICASCLKCKSCGTCNVTKFVGNLPMCTACFKLRQRGNFCPLCQKCYEENDFDLKMMECGDCEKWVHAKCEMLTDEQYNMLSLLPESIEFFCRRCTRKNGNLSDVWREAVSAEFRAGLLSVVKLLSKSRQACALLRLSPRKKSNICICQPINANRAIMFNKVRITYQNYYYKYY